MRPLLSETDEYVRTVRVNRALALCPLRLLAAPLMIACAAINGYRVELCAMLDAPARRLGQ